MKVCTDACLFGAWVTDLMRTNALPVKNILDIGTGTGLLSLMLAQELEPASVDAVEIDEAAANQASDNIDNSPWSHHIQVIRNDIRSVHLGRLYDLVISNPPFYENDLKSEDAQRNLALHGDALSLPELLSSVKAYLAPGGSFAVLLPYHRKETFISLAEDAGLYIYHCCDVRQSDKHDFFRTMLLFRTEPAEQINDTIIIRHGEVYSNKFIRLLKNYYLYL
jgi:tRNA1Val (adenine37-N6)-methyltransferase